MADIELNGVDLSTYGFTAREVPDLLDAPARSYAGLKQPDRPGQRVGLRSIGNRPFSVAGMLQSTSLAQAQTQLDQIMAVALAVQPSTVVMAWSTSRRLTAECVGVQVTPLGSPFGVFKYDVRLLFDAADPPFWQATTQHSVTTIQSTGKAMPMGNAPFSPQILVAGPTSNVEIKLQNSTAAQQASIKFTGINLTAADYLAIDMGARTVYQNVTGTFSSGTSKIAAMTSSGDFFDVLPEYADIANSSWPIMQCVTGGTSGGSATVYYYKAWN